MSSVWVFFTLTIVMERFSLPRVPLEAGIDSDRKENLHPYLVIPAPSPAAFILKLQSENGCGIVITLVILISLRFFVWKNDEYLLAIGTFPDIAKVIHKHPVRRKS